MVDALWSVEVIWVEGEGEGCEFLEGGDDVGGVSGGVDDVWVHFVVSDAAGPEGGGVWRGVALGDDVVEEDVALGVGVGGEEVVSKGGRAEDGGRGDSEGGGEEGAVGGGGAGAVGGVVNVRVGVFGGDGEVEGVGEVAAVDIEGGVDKESLHGGAGV